MGQTPQPDIEQPDAGDWQSIDYGYNSFYLGRTNFTSGDFAKITAIRSPSNTVETADSIIKDVGRSSASKGYFKIYPYYNTPTSGQSLWTPHSESGSVNVLWVDGHVQNIKGRGQGETAVISLLNAAGGKLYGNSYYVWSETDPNINANSVWDRW